MATRVAELSAVISADAKPLVNGLNEAQSSLSKTASGMKMVGGSLTELSSGLSIAKQAFGAVSGAIHSVIDPTVEYAAQVRNLGRSIGATAEESSKLIQAADDMNVSVGSLEAGLNAAIRKGVEPTIEGLGKLADQYNAIQDPIARTKFLMDNFGRSGADLAPLMEKGAAGIKELGDQAELAGLVLSQDGVDSMRKYELAVDQAQDSIMALKMALAKDLVPAITGYLNTVNENITVQQRYNRALEEGMLTKEEIRAIAVYDIRNAQDEAKAVLEAAEARREYSNTLVAVAHGYDGLTGSQNKAIEGVYDASRAAQASTDRWQGMADALGVAGKASDRFADAQAHAADAAAGLAAGLSGTMRDAAQDYQDVMADTTPEIARLTAEIAKYQSQQGKSFTVTENATTSVNEYQLATLKAAEAQAKLSEAAGASELEMAQLRVNADHAQESVVKLGEGFGITRQYTVDHTKALAEDSAALGEEIAKQDAAKAAFSDATAAFILQNIAFMAGPEASLAAARALGILSEADYELAMNVRQATMDWDLNKNGMIEAGIEADGLTNSLVGQQAAVERAAGVVPALTDHIGALSGQSEEAKQRISDLNSGIQALQDRTITVTVITDNYQNYHGYDIPGTGGGHASGIDMIVPPGYPHDSFQMNVQSGEHVVVTPAGGTGTGKGGNGATYNFIFNNAQPISIPTALQTAKAAAGAW